ncbi:ESX-3 secretion system protein EccC3 [Mycobacteroides abscessus subsp. abscessus]|nr:ESX-3 secretion system protein EccC3 [Mycobacteroides abscessus subsp. abscessus]
MRRDPLIFDATSAAGNVIIHGGPKSGKSTALQTFMLSAAALHSPRDVTFYCIDYGGGQLHALDGLAHVGSVASVSWNSCWRTGSDCSEIAGSPRSASYVPCVTATVRWTTATARPS